MTEVNNLRVSQENFTKFELARVIGSRALQISQGAPPMIKLDDEVLSKIGYNPIEIAKLEFESKVLPITVVRVIPGN